MSIPITVPRFGWSMDEGTFVGWLKEDGSAVRAGEPLFALEGEKGTQDVESLDDGFLRIAAAAPKPGDRVTVGAVLGHLVAERMTLPVDLPDAAEGETAPEPVPADPVPAPVTLGAATQNPPPVAGRPAAVSPRARRAARELGVDCAGLGGSGRSGRVRERDVRAAAERLARTVESPAPPARRSIPVTTARRTIAERMLASHNNTAPVTLTTQADATNLVNLRNQFKSAAEGNSVVPSFTDFLVKLTAAALIKHPLLNARWADDRIELASAIHIGIAVDTDAGLYVPVIRDVPTLGLRDLATRSRELVERARQGRLSADEMRDGTFTITSLGSFGIDAFTPLLNLPQCAILGIGRIRRQPAAVRERVALRDLVTLSLTFDHRVVDGAPAARFLQTLVAMLENPGPWLMS